MITEILLTIVILAFTGYIAWNSHQLHKANTKLVNALLAKKPEDMVNMTLADSTKVEASKSVQGMPDIVPIDQLSDEEFDAHIQEELAK